MKAFLALVTLAVALTEAHTHHHVDRAPISEEDQDSPNNIIFNGYVAPKGHVPYIVFLSLHNDTDRFRCGGSIIANTWILTAARCLEYISYVDIYYGTNLAGKSETKLRVEKENFIIHELHQNKTHFYDIALIRTPHVEFTNAIKKVDLPPPTLPEKFLMTVETKACGWGRISINIYPERLRCANLQIIKNRECGQTYKINGDHLCTGMANDKSVCAGDSGGPLVIPVTNPMLIGVASASTAWCGILTGPGIFTRVTSYLWWIREKTSIR